MKMKIDDLEEMILPKMEILKFYENRVPVEDESLGKNVVYIGKVYDLVYYNDRLIGNAYLARNDIRADGSEVVAWEVKTNELQNLEPRLLVNLYNGKAWRSDEYRGFLNHFAREKSLTLKEKLMSIVFDPIDKELMELFENIRNDKMDSIEYRLISH